MKCPFRFHLYVTHKKIVCHTILKQTFTFDCNAKLSVIQISSVFLLLFIKLEVSSHNMAAYPSHQKSITSKVFHLLLNFGLVKNATLLLKFCHLIIPQTRTGLALILFSFFLDHVIFDWLYVAKTWVTIFAVSINYLNKYVKSCMKLRLQKQLKPLQP